jgi:hypothetical protein
MPGSDRREPGLEAAWRLRWRAYALTGAHRIAPRPGPLSVPPQWTAWLLMDKAGVPRSLIARTAGIDPALLERRLRLAKAMLIFAPYAARVEALMRSMPAFAEPVPEAACAGQG